MQTITVNFHESNTRLRGWTRWAARAGWVVAVVLTLGLIISFLPVRLELLAQQCRQDEPSLAQLGLPVVFCTNWLIAFGIIVLFAFPLGAGIVFLSKSDDWMALLGAYQLITFGVVFSYANALVAVPDAWQLPINILRSVGGSLAYVFILLFPDGRFVPRWIGWLVFLSVAYAFSWLLFPQSPFNPYDFKNWPLAYVVAIGWVGIGLGAQMYRYTHVSNAVQRQQTKWIIAGLTVLFAAFFTVYLPLSIFPSLREPGLPRALYTLGRDPLFQVAMLFLLYCTRVSILRYHLWDIDIIIRRTLIYSILTAVLALIYFSAVILLQQLFRYLTGARNDLAIIISTLAIAALFAPLRRRIQNTLDRRFYRRRYAAGKVLAAFSTSVRDEVDLDKLNDRLLAVVDETMQPTHASLWIKKVG